MSKALLVKKGTEFIPKLTQKMTAGEIIIVGSNPSSTIQLDDSEAASEQLVIVCEEGQTMLLCRADGTKLNGQEFLSGALHDLDTGDVVAVGDYSFIVESAEKAESLLFEAEPVSENGHEDNSGNGNGDILPDNQIIEAQIDQKAENGHERKTAKQERSLNDVLEELRSGERFYFQIENGNGEKHNIYVEAEEMWMGWAESGECVITSNPHEIDIPRAYVRKDWSGVVLYPLQPENVQINGAPLEEPHRLKNDDRMVLLSKSEPQFNSETIVRFHEPTALLVLDSILPKELPPPVLLDQNNLSGSARAASREPGTGEDYKKASKSLPASAKIKEKRQYLGYFTLTEIIILTVGTLVTAAMIFLILELF